MYCATVSKVLLHIGTGKTGTTTLQNTLATNRSALAHRGWVYPELSNDQNQSLVPMLFMERSWARNLNIPVRTEDGLNQSRRQVESVFDNGVTSQSQWLLSSEYFGSMSKPVQIQAVVDFLGRWFDEIEVVAYFRRQDHLLPSLFSEAYRTWPLRQFAADPGFASSTRIDSTVVAAFAGLLDYQRLLAPWVDALGEPNVHARMFLESYKSNPDVLVDDFMSLIEVSDLSIGSGSSAGRPARASNTSLTAEAIAMVRRLAPTIVDLLRDPTAVDAASTPEVVALRRYVDRDAPADTEGVFARGAFNAALVAATSGPQLEIATGTAANVVESYTAANDYLRVLCRDDALWSRWIDQPPPSGGVIDLPMLDGQRFGEILAGLNPRTPFITRARNAIVRRARNLRAS